VKRLHVVPGLDEIGNGIAVAAKLIAAEQGAELVEARLFARGEGTLDGYDEVWVHSCWSPMTLKSCWRVLRAGKPLVRMTHANLDPVRLRYHGWKKWLVGLIERWCLRRCDRIVATCEAEKGWIEKYLGKKCPVVEVTDVKRFFELGTEFGSDGKIDAWRRGFQPRQVGDQNANSAAMLTRQDAASPNVGRDSLHILYLGRRHPLKGVEYLEKAVAELNSNPVNPVNPVQNSSTRLTSSVLSASLGTRFARLGRFPMGRAHPQGAVTRLCVRFVSNAFGEEKERVWDWCDVLVLPTLSDNFGLVIAEALERGKRVITTDGAPAWNHEIHETHEKGVWSGYGGRLIYLKGYRNGTDEERVELLKKAIERICK